MHRPEPLYAIGNLDMMRSKTYFTDDSIIYVFSIVMIFVVIAIHM